MDEDAPVELREEAVALLHCHRVKGREAGYHLVEGAADTPPALSSSAVSDS